MFVLSKLLGSFIVLPGLLILWGLIIVLLTFRQSKRAIRIWMVSFTLVLYFLSITPVSNFFLFPLEDYSKPLLRIDKIDAQYIVVLGGGVGYCSPEEAGNGSLNPDALKRLIFGYRLHRKTGLPLILSGGRVLEDVTVPSEGQVARELLIELGVPANKILVENRSRNTFENVLRIRELYKPKNIILVTSAYHMKRSMMCFAANNINAIAAPTDYKTRRIPCVWKNYLPSMNDLMNSYRALREYIGLLYYSIWYF